MASKSRFKKNKQPKTYVHRNRKRRGPDVDKIVEAIEYITKVTSEEIARVKTSFGLI